jgi:protein gp37
MAEGTKIEWTHRPGTTPATMNALVGCQKVSQGCANCYAIEVANIRAGNPLPVMQQKFAGTTKVQGGKRVWTGKVTLSEKALLDPLRRKAPRTYFVNALSDLFYDGVPDKWIDSHFAVFALCPQHTFIILTKRPRRMLEYFNSAANSNVQLKAVGIVSEWLENTRNTKWFQQLERQPVIVSFTPEGTKVRTGFAWPLPNVWLGVSVEDQATADERIELLRKTPAAVRLISAEPMMGEINIESHLCTACSVCGAPMLVHKRRLVPGCHHGVEMAMRPLDWVICGGESGPKARAMDPKWARSLRDQCAAAGVPFFFKQWGEWRCGERKKDKLLIETLPGVRVPKYPDSHLFPDGTEALRIGKKAAGHLLDRKQWHQFPAMEASR